MLKRWMIMGATVLASCSSDPDGKEWFVGETDMGAADGSTTNNSATPNNETPTSNNNVPNPNTSPAPTVPREGAALGGTCAVTFDCSEGLECTDVAEFEAPADLRCAEPECYCADPETTYCFEGDCAIADRNCVLDGCPTDYQCEGKVCLCNGPECEGGCRGDDHCNWDEICVEGGCRDAHCEVDAECPTRYVCGAAQNDRLCRVSGDGQVGDDCNQHSDCADGYCYDGVTCVAPCHENSECGERECSVPDHFDLAVPYCQAPTCGNCAADQYCQSGECRTEPCPDGECDWNAF